LRNETEKKNKIAIIKAASALSNFASFGFLQKVTNTEENITLFTDRVRHCLYQVMLHTRTYMLQLSTVREIYQQVLYVEDPWCLHT